MERLYIYITHTFRRIKKAFQTLHQPKDDKIPDSKNSFVLNTGSTV